ncbi:hypothetical protein [Thermus caldilimi]|uniref:hypothetical protein n=1 Tax=Thermus caldilimi TaxID=2483360 RepID=UPI0010767B62|nr:hypothetical protein [Thermus caldilimi]
MTRVKLRQQPEVARKVAEVWISGDRYLAKALTMGFKVLLDREFARYGAWVREGRLGEAGAYAIILARSPYAYKFPNRKAPRAGWRELEGLVERVLPLGDVKVLEAAVRLKGEADESEVLLLLELMEAGVEPEVLGEVVKRMVQYLPEGRKHGGGETTPPYMGMEVKSA